MPQHHGYPDCLSGCGGLQFGPDGYPVGYNERRHDLLYHRRINTGSNDCRHMQPGDSLHHRHQRFGHDHDQSNRHAGWLHKLVRVVEHLHNYLTGASKHYGQSQPSIAKLHSLQCPVESFYQPKRL